MEITEKQMKALRGAQQGELNGVAMYMGLADVVKDPADAETFRQLAKEEAGHASVFQAYTGEHLEAKPSARKMLARMYKLLGKKRLYPIIAKGEYSASKGYEALIADFPEVQNVLNDEIRHGDTVMALLEEKKYVTMDQA